MAIEKMKRLLREIIKTRPSEAETHSQPTKNAERSMTQITSTAPPTPVQPNAHINMERRMRSRVWEEEEEEEEEREEVLEEYVRRMESFCKQRDKLSLLAHMKASRPILESIPEEEPFCPSPLPSCCSHKSTPTTTS